MTARSLVLAASLVLLGGCTAGATPAPASPAASPAPSLLTGSPSPATSAPAPTVSADVPRVQLPVGALAVTVTEAVRVRSAPWVADDSIKYEPVLSLGTHLHVLDGPVAGSGYWWYHVELEKGRTLDNSVAEGWVASADHDGTPWIDWLVDADPGSYWPSGSSRCPDEVTPSALVALDLAARIACYGSTTLAFAAGILPAVVVGDIDEFFLQEPARFRTVVDPTWGRLYLVDSGTAYDGKSSLELYVADPSMHLPVFFNPPVVAGESSPPIDNVSGGVAITGHFDDPASAECRAPVTEGDGLYSGMTDADAILWCRSRFIVTAAETGG